VALVLPEIKGYLVGTYLLDADDLWKPTKLQKQMDFMMTNNAPFTFSL
jgi:hypothetical protein